VRPCWSGHPVIEDGAEAEAHVGPVAMVTEAFALQNQQLSGNLSKPAFNEFMP
jgi:hypothetical protein